MEIHIVDLQMKVISPDNRRCLILPLVEFEADLCWRPGLRLEIPPAITWSRFPVDLDCNHTFGYRCVVAVA